jgi:hemerythrin superfamily protein
MPQPSNGHFGRLATSAALGLAAGLVFPHARKAVMQAPSVVAGDWVEALTTEHRMVEKLFDQLMKTTERDSGKREMLLAKIAYALTKHAVEEENVIYPALKEAGRAEESGHLTEDHGQIKTHIYDLRRMSARDPQWMVEASTFRSMLMEHIREEEQDIFPAFREAIGPEENGTLTTMLNWEGFKVA